MERRLTRWESLLVVDRDQATCDLLASRIAEEGYAVSMATDALQALETMREHEFDLVIADVMMADTDGNLLLQQMKADDKLCRLPVILLSAPDQMDRVVKSFELGADDFLPKPVAPVILRAKIVGCLEKKRLRQREEGYVQQIEEGERRSEELLHLILPLGVALSSESDFDRLSERILVEAISICNADGGTLYLRTDDDLLAFAIVYNHTLNISMGGTTGVEVALSPLHLYGDNGEPNHQNVATFAALEGRSINIPDSYHAPNFDFSGTRAFDQAHNYSTISLLGVPLKNRDGKVIGEIQLINAKEANTGHIIPFDPYLQEVVESLASQVSVALRNELLRSNQVDLEKKAEELRIAHQIQEEFLPEVLPEPPGWELACRFKPARDVAGDFYDVIPLSGNHLGLVIADVCDKGVPAALYMALFRSLIRAFSEKALSSDRPELVRDETALVGNSIRRRLGTLLSDLHALNTVTLTNNYVASVHGRTAMFATLFFGVLDPYTGVLTYVNGGHEAPIILGVNGVKARLRPTGPAVGMMPGMEFDIEEAHLEPGDVFFGYSDGVTDAKDPAGQRFTEARLLELLAQPVLSVSTLLDNIEAAVRSHIAGASQFDDITMLSLRRATLVEKSESCSGPRVTDPSPL